MAKQLSSIYGEALFGAAGDAGRIDEIYEEILSLRDAFRENDDLLKIMNHPKISKEEKTQIIHRICEGKVSGEIEGLFRIIIEKDRQKEIPAVMDYYIRRVKEYRGIGTALVRSAVELTQDRKKRLVRRLIEKSGYQSFETEYEVDPSLLGGMVIRVGDRVYDSSLKTQLYTLQKELSGIRL